MITPRLRRASQELTWFRWASSMLLELATSKLALLPSLSPVFADSAANLNPAYRALVPQLQAEFPNAEITLSNWGPFFESVLRNASQYGFSNTSADGCFSYTTNTQTCASPGSYYFYYPNHPSTAVHR